MLANLANVEAGDVRQKIVPDHKAHQHPVIQDSLKVVFEGDVALKIDVAGFEKKTNKQTNIKQPFALIKIILFLISRHAPSVN